MCQYMQMIRNMDPKSTGFVNYRQLVTYFILLESSVPTEQQAEQIAKAADQAGNVSKEAFVSAKFWFEEQESSKDHPQNQPFDRRKLIKEILFDANCKVVEGQEGATVCAKDLIDILRLPAASKNCTNFHDFIFAPIEQAQN